MKNKVVVRKLHDESAKDEYIENPEESLSMVELLRIEAGNFLYEYPITFQRVVKVIRKQQR